MLKGVPVSAGVCVARAYCVDNLLARRAPNRLEESSVQGEISRLDAACQTACRELDEIIGRVSKQLGEEEAAIFRSHRMLLRDPALIGKVKLHISTKKEDARTALLAALDDYSALFARIEDEYLKERMADIRDVVGRIVSHLSLESVKSDISFDEPVIIIAAEILPSQALAFEKLKIVGIVTEQGSTTGHAAILARSLGIPAISGIENILRIVKTGDLIALDGREGHLHLNPGPEVESAYRKLQREFFDLRDRLVENHEQEAVTLDLIQVELLANVNGPADAAMASKVGAGGVGLYRTEYLFLTHPSVPNEEEQLATYKQVVEAAPRKTVTIRTLDLGGDKQVPYLGNHRETNPFMGYRSIRLSTAHPEFFLTQLRAILRVGLLGRVSLLFPMVSTLEEVQRLKRMVIRAKSTLEADDIPFEREMPLGVMIEVPAAALCIESLLEEVDFVSIGSNDLIQYIMAADRDNPKVAHLCDPFNPALMRLLHHIVSTCEKHGKPVTLCGEMAGRPRCFLPLLGMGLRKLSMSPAFIPSIKELARRSSLELAAETIKRVLQMKTFGEIRGFLSRRTRKVWPDVTLLDTTD